MPGRPVGSANGNNANIGIRDFTTSYQRSRYETALRINSVRLLKTEGTRGVRLDGYHESLVVLCHVTLSVMCVSQVSVFTENGTINRVSLVTLLPWSELFLETITTTIS